MNLNSPGPWPYSAEIVYYFFQIPCKVKQSTTVREKPRESREKNQRETEEMYKSFGSGFNPRQKSISFLQRFFL